MDVWTSVPSLRVAPLRSAVAGANVVVEAASPPAPIQADAAGANDIADASPSADAPPSADVPPSADAPPLSRCRHRG